MVGGQDAHIVINETPTLEERGSRRPNIRCLYREIRRRLCVLIRSPIIACSELYRSYSLWLRVAQNHRNLVVVSQDLGCSVQFSFWISFPLGMDP